MAMSPLVMAQRKAPQPHNHTTPRHTTHAPTHILTKDVSSPAAARARASTVNNFEGSLKKQSHIPLQRALLLSTGAVCWIVRIMVLNSCGIERVHVANALYTLHNNYESNSSIELDFTLHVLAPIILGEVFSLYLLYLLLFVSSSHSS